VIAFLSTILKKKSRSTVEKFEPARSEKAGKTPEPAPDTKDGAVSVLYFCLCHMLAIALYFLSPGAGGDMATGACETRKMASPSML
jgi:hypothetical protein